MALKGIDLENTRLCVVTPCHHPVWCSNYGKSMLGLYCAATQLGLDLNTIFIEGESDIVRARNEGAARFLETDGTHCLWIDSDIGFEPKAVFRLLSSGYDFVGAVYRKKDDNAGFAADPQDVGAADLDGFATITELPAGFMLVKRSVFEKIKARAYKSRDLQDNLVKRRGFFDTMLVGEEYKSEDYSFCYRWLNAGGKIYVDTCIDLSHQGTKLYRGNFFAAVHGTRDNSGV
jgi:hypothetical protein